MAGDPIIYPHKCAVVMVREPAASALEISELSSFVKQAAVLSYAIGCPTLELPANHTGPWLIGDDLLSQIANLERKAIIISGALLEGAVTQVSLLLLLEGYDVFVCADLCYSSEPEQKQMFLDRIRSCAGVTLTYKQIVLEVLAQESDPDKRGRLNSLLSNEGI